MHSCISFAAALRVRSPMSWHCITLSAQDYAAGELAILQGAFREAYIAANAPAGMALFGTWNEDHSRYLVYTTPASTRRIRPLLEAYAARPLAPARRADLILLVGDETGRYAPSGQLEA